MVKGKKSSKFGLLPAQQCFAVQLWSRWRKEQELPRGVSHHAEHLHVKNGSSCSFWAQSKENRGALTCTCSESRLMELLGEPEAEKRQVWEWHLPMPGWNKEGEVKTSQWPQQSLSRVGELNETNKFKRFAEALFLAQGTGIDRWNTEKSYFSA